MLGISLKHPRKARSQSLMLIDSYNRLRTDIIKRLAIDEDRLPCLSLSQTRCAIRNGVLNILG